MTQNSGFAVEFIKCPHFKKAEYSKEEFIEAIKKTECDECKEKEIWVCMTCLKVKCSRYFNGHSLKHYEKEKHPVVYEQRQGIFWCYECDSYVYSPELDEYEKIGKEIGKQQEKVEIFLFLV